MTAREALRQLAPIVSRQRLDRLWQAYLMADVKEKREIESMIEAFAARALQDHPSLTPAGLFPPPAPEVCLGDIDLGTVQYGGKNAALFGLRLEELQRHLGIYGSSGCGKSNGIALILGGFIENKIPFLLCDFKRTFRGLLMDYSDILVFTAGDSHTAPFRFNPLIPPQGTSIEVWAKKVISALSHAYCQGAGSESLLISAVSEAYADAARKNRWPTFQDVAEVLEAQPARGRKAMWMDSAKRAVTSISTGNMADVFCPAASVDLGRLLDNCVVLELDLLNQAEQTFLSEALLLWVIQYRMNNNAARESLCHAILIEEAHHLLRAPPGVGDGAEPVIHIALREVRELGESIILATQNASIVPLAVFGNQANTIAMNTKHYKDVSGTAQAMLLKDDAKDELGRLPVGEAIVRVPRTPNPIHIKLKYRPVAKGKVSDAAIRQHMAKNGYSANTVTYRSPETERRPVSGVPRPDEEHLKQSDSPVRESSSTHGPVIAAGPTPTTTPRGQQIQTTFQEPSELEMAVVKDILKHPFDGVVKRIHRLNVSRRKGTAALAALEGRGFIAAASIYTGASLIKLFDLTPQGRAFCAQRQIGQLPEVTQGGVEHRFWIDHVAGRLNEQGWCVKMEYRAAEDVVVDIAAERDARNVAVLVETGKSNLEGNVRKTIDAGYNEIWVVSNNPAVRSKTDKIRGAVPDDVALRFLRPDQV